MLESFLDDEGRIKLVRTIRPCQRLWPTARAHGNGTGGLRTNSDFAIVRSGGDMGLAPEYIVVDGQTLSKTKLSLDNHVYKNCSIDECDIYYSGGQYELIDTHVTNSRLILNHPAKGIYAAIQIFKMKSPGSRIIAE